MKNYVLKIAEQIYMIYIKSLLHIFITFRFLSLTSLKIFAREFGLSGLFLSPTKPVDVLRQLA